MDERNAAALADNRIEFRIGVHQGDIVVEDRDIFGDGVNVAARLEGLAEPGGICVSRVVRDQVRDKLDVEFDDRGEQRVKNIARPIRVFDVRIADATTTLPSDSPQRTALALPLTNHLSRSYHSRTSVEIPSRNISPTAWLRKSLPR